MVIKSGWTEVETDIHFDKVQEKFMQYSMTNINNRCYDDDSKLVNRLKIHQISLALIHCL